MIKLLIAGRSPALWLPDKPKALFIEVLIHDNLGNHLLADVGLSLLITIFAEWQITEVSIEEYMLNKRRIANSLCSSDNVFAAGSGWMGGIWPNDEMIILDVVEL